LSLEGCRKFYDRPFLGLPNSTLLAIGAEQLLDLTFLSNGTEVDPESWQNAPADEQPRENMAFRHTLGQEVTEFQGGPSHQFLLPEANHGLNKKDSPIIPPHFKHSRSECATIQAPQPTVLSVQDHVKNSALNIRPQKNGSVCLQCKTRKRKVSQISQNSCSENNLTWWCSSVKGPQTAPTRLVTDALIWQQSMSLQHIFCVHCQQMTYQSWRLRVWHIARLSVFTNVW